MAVRGLKMIHRDQALAAWHVTMCLEGHSNSKVWHVYCSAIVFLANANSYHHSVIPQDVYREVFGKMRFCEFFSHGHASRARCIKFTCACGGRKAKVKRDIQTTHTEED